jgi:uncharacterized protein YbaP (TraB family)
VHQSALEQQLHEENRAIRQRLREASAHGRDVKHLAEDVRLAREVAELESMKHQIELQATLASENQVRRARVLRPVQRRCTERSRKGNPCL